MSTNIQPSRPLALRGATTATANEPRAIVEATVELLEAMLDRNSLTGDHVVSVVFTSTEDLTAEFPAAGARALGLGNVPLLCAGEIPVPGSLPHCIRVLMSLWAPRAPDDLRHVYLRGARELPSNLTE